MQAALFQKIEASVSKDRLGAYRQEGDRDFDVICKYLWNIHLCESLYPTIQTLEVVLRNSFHAAAIRRYGAPDWFEKPKSPLLPREQDAVEHAKNELQKLGKPTEPCRVVAEVTFGFWTGLFNAPYERIFWPWMLERVFPKIPKTIRTRRDINRRLNEVRHLRNRVFHHERVSHWPNLAARHADIIETIGWISPEWQVMMPTIDRFTAVHKNGLQAIRLQLQPQTVTSTTPVI